MGGGRRDNESPAENKMGSSLRGTEEEGEGRECRCKCCFAAHRAGTCSILRGPRGLDTFISEAGSQTKPSAVMDEVQMRR